MKVDVLLCAAAERGSEQVNVTPVRREQIEIKFGVVKICFAVGSAKIVAFRLLVLLEQVRNRKEYY